MTGPAIPGGPGVAIISSPTYPATSSGAAGAPSWSDEDAQDMAMVLRRIPEVQAQVRSAQHVRELKALYQNACNFCGKKMVIGVDPSKHYSEAAHIKPIGQPHNGPDRKANMIILCPEHHLQFDRGVLRIRKLSSGGFRIASKIPGDPLNGTALQLRAPHSLEEDSVSWHYDFWKQ